MGEREDDRATSMLLERFLNTTGLGADADVLEVVNAVQALPYGRAPERTGESALDAGRGTCSTKHYLLAELLREGWPDVGVEVVHRVYRMSADDARRMFGEPARAAVPADGLVDVHTYLLVDQGAGAVIVDVTFPDHAMWDGRSSMALACGPGEDHPAREDPEAVKAQLVETFCDPSVREPFIAALSEPA